MLDERNANQPLARFNRNPELNRLLSRRLGLPVLRRLEAAPPPIDINRARTPSMLISIS